MKHARTPTEHKTDHINRRLAAHNCEIHCAICMDRFPCDELFPVNDRYGDEEMICWKCKVELEDETPGMTQFWKTIDEKKEGGDWDELIGRLHRMGQQIDDLKNTAWYRRKTA